MSQDAVSRAERGRFGEVTIAKLRSIAATLDAEALIVLRWRAGDLDRLVDEGHAAILGTVAAMLSISGWQVRSEVSYSVYGERGSIDILAWHAPTRTLLVIEIKTELNSVEETLRKHDEKTRLAPRIASERFGWRAVSVGRLLVLPDLSTPRRRVSRHREILERAYPLRGFALRSWLRDPGLIESRAGVAGLLFVSPTRSVRGRCGPVSRKRIRGRSRSFVQHA